MDTKLKNSKYVKAIISFIIIGLFVAISFGIIIVSPNAKLSTYGENFNTYELPNLLNRVNYGVYQNLIEKREQKAINPADYLMKVTGAVEADNLKHLKEEINSNVKGSRDTLINGVKNLEYFAVDKVSKTSVYSNEYSDGIIIKEDLSQEEIKNIKDKHSFYVVVDYDDKGVAKVINSFGIDKELVKEIYANKVVDAYPEGVEATDLRNVTFVYSAPKSNSMVKGDLIYSILNTNKSRGYVDTITKLMVTSGIISLILALAIPYEVSRKVLGFKTLSKIPLEILFIGEIVLIILLEEVINTRHAFSFISESGDFISSILNFEIDKLIVYGLIIICIFAGLYSIFIAITVIKHIINLGFREYFKKYTIIGRIINFIINTGKKVGDFIVNTDIRESNNKKILSVLGINFLAVSVFCLMWFVGIFFAVIYTIVLFVIAKKYLNNIKDKYNKLFEATNEIAKGNLDVKIDEDLGLFETFNEEIKKIQVGLKKSVAEEVKSQRMKTELISNVSHDLKTPLTSIITYVDLLKDKSLTEEKRKLYLDTLDKKSQRLQYLIEDLFEISKATSGNINLNIVEVDVVSLMKQTLLELDDKIENSSLIIRSNFPNEKVILSLDSQRMFRVFENLIINITKYALEESRVYINIENMKDKVEIVLKNISKEEIRFDSDDITERFARGDKARNTEGSGLGLSIAKSFVELQGGMFKVKVDGDLFKVSMSFMK